MDSVDVGGLTIGFERAGAGPPVVLLNGYVGDGPRTWRHQLDGLADEFTVVAWDAPGSGRSSDPPASFRMPDYADCLAGFVDALGLGRCHVAGLSFGGTVAIELHHRHPEVAASLVLAGAYAGWAGSLAPEEAQHRLDQALALADQPPDRLVAALAPTMLSPSAPAGARDEIAAVVSAFHPAGFRSMARAVAEADLREALTEIGVPTLLLYGDEDVRAAPAVAEALHAAIPGSSLVFLRGAGHVCCIEAPEAFNRELRRFLVAVDGR
jgi:pimeloyl-ACP methyl ester carboxylesterase